MFMKVIKILRLQDKHKRMEEDLQLVNKKISMLKDFNNEPSIDSLLKNYSEKELFMIFNDIAIRNIDKKEEIKKNNKILLEKYLASCKDYKNLKGN